MYLHYSNPSVYAVAVANQNSRKSNSRYTSHSVDKMIVQKCQKNFYKALYIVLIEIFLDRIKNRVIENRVMENRVKRGNIHIRGVWGSSNQITKHKRQ